MPFSLTGKTGPFPNWALIGLVGGAGVFLLLRRQGGAKAAPVSQTPGGYNLLGAGNGGAVQYGGSGSLPFMTTCPDGSAVTNVSQCQSSVLPIGSPPATSGTPPVPLTPVSSPFPASANPGFNDESRSCLYTQVPGFPYYFGSGAGCGNFAGVGQCRLDDPSCYAFNKQVQAGLQTLTNQLGYAPQSASIGAGGQVSNPVGMAPGYLGPHQPDPNYAVGPGGTVPAYGPQSASISIQGADGGAPFGRLSGMLSSGWNGLA